MAVSLEQVSIGYGGAPLVSGLDVEVRPGEVWCLLGRNGVGKSTLFRTVLGLLPAVAGTVRLDGSPVTTLGGRELAQRVAHVPQSADASFGYTVHEVVLMGRAPWLGWYGVPRPEDHRIADEMLERLGIGDLGEQAYRRLSGGQRQMVLIARALAQQSSTLMMDEPMASLDLGNEARVLRTIVDLAGQGLSVVFTTHRPDHAFAVADRVLLLLPGGGHRHGPVDDVLTLQTMEAAFGTPLAVLQSNDRGGARMRACVPLLADLCARDGGVGVATDSETSPRPVPGDLDG